MQFAEDSGGGGDPVDGHGVQQLVADDTPLHALR
jgi:hypothetical protein